MKKEFFILLLMALSVACHDDREIPAPRTQEPQDTTSTTPADTSATEPPVRPGEEIDYDLSVLDQPLTKEMIFTRGTWLQNRSVMQSFALKGLNYMYAVQVAASGTTRRLNVTYKGVLSNTGKQLMQLEYYGHGSNLVLEEAEDGDYLWVGSYGTQTKVENGNEYYTNNQTVARVKFRMTGTTAPLQPEDAEDHFCIPGMKNIHPAIDWANRQIAFWCVGTTDGYFFVYDLDEALALPETTMPLPLQITRGGDNEAFAKETKYYDATVHDLSALTPIAKITLPPDGVIGNGSNQGFELHSGRIYHYAGAGNNNDGATPCTSMVTVFDFKGNVTARKQVMAVYSIEDLKACSLTDSGFMESEGIKIYGDCLYLGYATKWSESVEATPKRYVTILKYPLSRL